MIQITDLSEEQIDEIGRAIGDSFFLVVRKEYQGQGYMRQLMKFAYEKADQYGVPCILDTDAKNKLNKYCHLGMKHVATRKIDGDCFLYDLMRE